MAKTCLAIRHVGFEDLGIFAPVLDAAGYETRYFDVGTADVDAADIASVDLLIILGGPVSAFDGEKYPFIAEEIDAVRARLAAGLPTFGVCLGHQIIAAALGANVGPGPAKEIGWAPVALTAEGRDSVIGQLAGVPVLHWHSDIAALPEGATRLAETDLCRNQAFAIGSNVLALQFHIEADPSRIERWLVGHAVELAGAEIDPAALRLETRRHGVNAALAGVMVLRRWLDGLGQRDAAIA